MAGNKISYEQVRRTRGGVPLSDHELDMTERAAQQAGMPRAAYWREAILEAAAADLGETLDALDTTRRPAPRQPNRQQRKDTTR